MAAGPREREQIVHGRASIDELGVGRPTAPHRHDHHRLVSREQPGDTRRDRSLPDALARSDHRDRRSPDRFELWRIEAEIGPLVRDAERERPRRQPEARRRREHGLVRKIEHDIGLKHRDRILERRDERHAVVLSPTQLLRAAHEHRGHHVVRELDQGVPHHRGVVLPVDHGNGPHERDVTSDSIRPVYFSYSKVSVENWMMRSCPWNGWRRQMSTWLPVISTTL